MSFSTKQYREALGRFATGVAVVTCPGDGMGPVGVTVNSFSSLSLDPPLILWCLDKGSDRSDVFRNCDHFVVNVLATGQQDLSVRFAEVGQHDFSGIRHEPGVLGVPVLPDALAVLECNVEARHDGGDHVIYVGRVLEMSSRDGEPLLYFSGQYREIKHKT